MNNQYISDVTTAMTQIDKNIVDIGIKRERGTPPTQASSEFITNKQQGDWAEKTLMHAFNNASKDYISVKYGLDIELVAGDPGFNEFYEKYQDELDTIGKKPDLLIFHKKDYKKEWGLNISDMNADELDKIVPLAVCGIEVRSSSFLDKKYNDHSKKVFDDSKEKALAMKQLILSKHGTLLSEKSSSIYQIISLMDDSNIHQTSFRSPSWKKSPDEIELSKQLKTLNSFLQNLKKRDFLSITPKVEDLKVVYNWILRYGVPHFYVQVFFDSAFGIGFLDILRLVSDKSKQGVDYFVESGDAKNQNKTTIKINSRLCTQVLDNVIMPKHSSQSKEVGDRGRLLFYVNFEYSKADVLGSNLNQLINQKLI